MFAGFCKEPGFFSGAVRRLNGETEQEFENDTLEILASVLTMRIGKLISKPDSILIPIKKEMESQEIKSEVNPILSSSMNIHESKNEMIKMLLQKGANVNSKTVEGSTPLMFAVYYGDLQSVKILVIS